jgi:hypothetical protein
MTAAQQERFNPHSQWRRITRRRSRSPSGRSDLDPTTGCRWRSGLPQLPLYQRPRLPHQWPADFGVFRFGMPAKSRSITAPWLCPSVRSPRSQHMSTNCIQRFPTSDRRFLGASTPSTHECIASSGRQSVHCRSELLGAKQVAEG